MNMSHAEKLIIYMLAQISEKLNISDPDPSFLKAAIHSECEWAITSELPGLFGDDKTLLPPVVSETFKIMTMWSVLERSYGKLSLEDRKAFSERAVLFKSGLKFDGFDGNYETEHYGNAIFIVNRLDRFQEFKDRSLNSHAPLLESYRNMLDEFEKQHAAKRFADMDLESLIQVANAFKNAD